MTHAADDRYMRGIELVPERALRYRDAIRRAGVEEMVAELARADTHSSAARLAMRMVLHLFGPNR